jgi:tetratricopeptide (TPR) repeat protein
MIKIRYARYGVLIAALGLSAVSSLAPAPAFAQAAETVKPAIGTAMHEAADLYKAKKFKEALAKLRDADAVPGKTAYESYVIESTRGSYAMAAGDKDTAVKAYEAVVSSGRVSGAQKLQMYEALGDTYYGMNNLQKASTWFGRYLSEGGDDPNVKKLMTQISFQSGDCSKVSKDINASVRAEEKAGHVPSESDLQMLANCVLKDKVAYVSALEKLTTYYPKKEYWKDLLNRLPVRPGYSERLVLDMYRLRQELGQLTTLDDYMEMSQLALQAELPAEAQKIIDQGYKAGIFGVGPEAARHQRLKDLAARKAAEAQKALAKNTADAESADEGTALVNLGFAFVTAGQFQKGIDMMNEGITKDKLSHPDDAKLHLGIAQLWAGKKSDAVKTLRSVQGTDGTADLARYWIIQANHPIGK